MKQKMKGLCLGLCWLALATSPLQAQEGAQGAQTVIQQGEREVRIEDRRLRFVIRDDWQVQAQDGVYVVRAPDQKMLMMLFTLDRVDEIPGVMADLDKLVPVRDATFSEPHAGLHRGIPTELLFGRGVLVPTEIPVELAVATMRVGEKPVLAVFYVHKPAFEKHFSHVKRTIDSFSLILTEAEAAKLKEELKARSKAP
jgi:hypothetical protein